MPAYNSEEYDHLAVVVTKNTGTSTTIVVYINGSPITMAGVSGSDTPLSDTEQESYTSSATPWIGNASIGAPGSPTQTWGTPTTMHIKEFGLFNTPLDAARYLFTSGSIGEVIFVNTLGSAPVAHSPRLPLVVDVTPCSTSRSATVTVPEDTARNTGRITDNRTEGSY